MGRFLPPSLLPEQHQLLQALGDEMSEPKQYYNIMHDVQEFMRDFKSVTTETACDLYDQRLQDHRGGVKEMVDTFLESKRKGQLYWPAENTSSWALRYPEDRSRHAYSP